MYGQTTGRNYVEFSAYVRQTLKGLGVDDSDLSDLCHEVLLVAHNKLDEMGPIDDMRLWLRAISRRVASGYRRKARRRREILIDNPDGWAPTHESASDEVLGATLSSLRRGLDTLDDEGRDLVALHDGGGMSLSELARLVDLDRKTVRKRLDAARRRLATSLREQHRAELEVVASAGEVEGSDDLASHASPSGPGDPLEVFAVTENLNVGRLGNVVVTTWCGAVTVDAVDRLVGLGPELVAGLGGAGAYFAVVEASARPPGRAARKKLVEALDTLGPSCIGYATAVLGKAAWIVRPIMNAAVLVSRPRFPMQFFSGIPLAASWLSAHFARSATARSLDCAELCAAAEHLRQLRP